MYYIYKQKEDKKYSIVELTNTNDGTYNRLQQEFDLQGQFGRLDYAEIWRDFYNGLFQRTTLRLKLDRIKI